MGGSYASWKVDKGGAGNEKGQLSILDWTMGESRLRCSSIALDYIHVQPRFGFYVKSQTFDGLGGGPYPLRA